MNRLQATQPQVGKLSRRAFIGGTGAAGGLALGLGWPASTAAQDAPKFGAYGMGRGLGIAAHYSFTTARCAVHGQ